MSERERSRVPGLRFALVAALLCISLSARGQMITEYAVPSAATRPNGIAAGPDGNIWFTEDTGKRIGRVTPSGAITEFPVLDSGFLGMITAGPDGNLWFAGGANVFRITLDGAVTRFAASGSAYGITAGPDGNLWFTDRAGKIGRITPAGLVTVFPVPTANSQPFRITAGADGNLWFTEAATGKVGRITTAGTITEFALPKAGSDPLGITAGPDGNIWFIEKSNAKIGRITPGGVITEFPIGTSGEAIALGPDGNFWFTDDGGGIGRMTPAGAVTFFPIPGGGNSSPVDIAAGPDGNLWFTELNGNKVGKITPGCVPGADVLCLQTNRFRVTAAWRSAQGAGAGQAVPLTDDSGYFWFFTSGNVELIVKALNGCGFNSRIWVFAGGLTNVEVTITVTDMVTGAVKTYVNPLNTPFQPIQDTAAFQSCPAAGAVAPESAVAESPHAPAPDAATTVAACADDATSLCLNNGRFRATAAWRSSQASGPGFAVRLTSDSGYFWFFTASNVELIVKALNGCSFNTRYWVFAGGLTNVEVTLTVTDTLTGAVKTYVNPLNTAFQPIQDTAAFATCP